MKSGPAEKGITNLSDARQRVIATLILYNMHSKSDDDALKLLQERAKKDERDKILTAVVRELMALRQNNPFFFDESHSNDISLPTPERPGLMQGDGFGSKRRQAENRALRDGVEGVKQEPRESVRVNFDDLSKSFDAHIINLTGRIVDPF